MPFYESLGFVRVGAVARYDEFSEEADEGGGADASPSGTGGDGTNGTETVVQRRERQQREQDLMKAVWEALNSSRAGGQANGRSLAELFLNLPPKREYPEYYKVRIPVVLLR